MRVLIVEDELPLARRLEGLCREILGAQLEKVRIATEFSEASTCIDHEPVELLLLDLNVHGTDGMELLKRSDAGAFHTIVVSAIAEHAVRAFEYGVVDFIPKPVTRERLAQGLARLTDREGWAACAAKFLAVRKQHRVDLVPLDQVLYVQGAGAYAELVLGDGTRELYDKTLEKVQLLLPPVFERVHKSYIVRLSAVKSVHVREGGRYEAELSNRVRIPVGRTHYRALMDKLR